MAWNTAGALEFLTEPLAPGESLDYSFNTTADLSITGAEYQIRAWTSHPDDSNFGNDSITDFRVQNFSLKPGFREDFEAISFVDGSCLNPANDIWSKGWSVANDFGQWNLQDARVCGNGNGATSTFATGPRGDHSFADGNGTFVYVEADFGTPFDGALLTSPCIDFRESTGAAMAFWFHKFGVNMGNLYIDVLADGVWNMAVDSIIGQTHFSIDDKWSLKSVNLTQFAGKLIQIRFRGHTLGFASSDMAIDDIEIFEPIPQDARISDILTPNTSCEPDSLVSVKVENFGTDTIFANSIIVKYAVNGLTPAIDTVDVDLAPGESVIHDFSTLGVFVRPNTTFNIESWTELLGDDNRFNDTAFHVLQNITQTIDYEEDFESFMGFQGGCAAFAVADVLRRAWVETTSGGGANFFMGSYKCRDLCW